MILSPYVRFILTRNANAFIFEKVLLADTCTGGLITLRIGVITIAMACTRASNITCLLI